MSKNTVILIIVIYLLTACQNHMTHVSQRDMKSTLALAGSNRDELERVLEHYQDDPQKLAAARYLIADMKDNYYLVSDGIDSVHAALVTTSLQEGFLERNRRDRWMAYRYEGTAEKIYDAQTVSAEYLIENIDLAFESWQRYPWGKYYDFEDFCNYLLPYKIGDEKPDNWRRIYTEKFAPVLDSLYKGTDVVVAVDMLQHYLQDNYPFIYNNDFSYPRVGGEFLLEYPIGACREETAFLTYMLRSLGIPATSDGYIYSPDSFLGHNWNVFLDTTGVFIPTEIMRTGVSRDWKNSRTKGKAYRSGEDVTSMYYPENKVILPMTRGVKGGFISVFSMNGWIPIGVYKRSLTGRAYVSNLETGHIYQPLDPDTRNPSGYAFYVDDFNKAHALIPDVEHPQKVKLTRKHPLTKYWVNKSHEMDSIAIHGSADGKHWELIGMSNTGDKIERTRQIFVDQNASYKYIRLTPPEKTRLNIAELDFYRDVDCTGKIRCIAAEAPASMSNLSEYAIDKATDGKNLTRYESGTPGAACVFELELPSEVSCIVYAPRNDDNYVSPGDVYELFYQDGVNGWVSLGVKTAEDWYLEYDNVPAGALLWLHNHTKGVEEQAFRWDNGSQIFCYKL